MYEFDQLTRLLQWRLEYFGSVMNILEEIGVSLEGVVGDMLKREEAIWAFCKAAKNIDELARACRLAMWSYRVVDSILNYETSNAISALRRVDYILGEKDA